MSATSWVFPTGAALTIGGVVLCALLEWHSFGQTHDWVFTFLAVSFLPSLLLGTPLAIIGSFVDRKRLPEEQFRARGKVCWVVSGISLLLFITVGNVHRWTFTYIFPAVTGFVTGMVFLSHRESSSHNA
jgi:hypothetical protein